MSWDPQCWRMGKKRMLGGVRRVRCPRQQVGRETRPQDVPDVHAGSEQHACGRPRLAAYPNHVAGTRDSPRVQHGVPTTHRHVSLRDCPWWSRC